MQGETVNVTVTAKFRNNNTVINDPGFVYVSVTEDMDLMENLTPDLPTQLYLENDLDFDQIKFLFPQKALGQYFGNGGNTSNDLSLEYILVS